MPSKKTKKRDQLPFWRWILDQIFELVRQFGNQIIWAGVTTYLVYELGRTFWAFAGTVSVANLALRIAGYVNVVITASVALSGLTSVLWLIERSSHRRTRKRLTERTEALEKRLDPNRKSSLLTREGTTRKGDQ